MLNSSDFALRAMTGQEGWGRCLFSEQFRRYGGQAWVEQQTAEPQNIQLQPGTSPSVVSSGLGVNQDRWLLEYTWQFVVCRHIKCRSAGVLE
jgi:hypothetical protein